MKKTMYNKSEIMKNAWTIRRRNGYSMSEALRRAWTNAKRVAEMDREEAAMEASKTFTAEQLVAAGGKLWEKGSYRRVYFNKDEIINICDVFAELDCNRVAGEKISNTTRRQYMETINGGLYYDLSSHEFNAKWSSRYFDEVAKQLILAIA